MNGCANGLTDGWLTQVDGKMERVQMNALME